MLISSQIVFILVILKTQDEIWFDLRELVRISECFTEIITLGLNFLFRENPYLLYKCPRTKNQLKQLDRNLWTTYDHYRR